MEVENLKAGLTDGFRQVVAYKCGLMERVGLDAFQAGGGGGLGGEVCRGGVVRADDGPFLQMAGMPVPTGDFLIRQGLDGEVCDFEG